MTGYDPETLRFYQEEAPVYTASGTGGAARHLPDFLTRLNKGAKILELGCGGGIDAAYMIAQGFEVTPTDGTPAIATLAEKRIGQTVSVMRFDQLDAVEEFDAVVASASLLHAPRTELPSILRLIWDSLKPGGWHIATYKGGGVEGRDGFGRYFNYLNRIQLLDYYLAAAKWTDIDIVEGMGGGYDGKQGPWLRIVARKPV
ncbi:MAG: class I SAM-dependent methyltransferase [Sphingorhabdus sp.]|uniref:class I SAM-dependent methyltransferase n=1 Tax=Sphingorhabdus sp. TaxID=1902408 RepID=UPI003CA322B4